MIKQRYLELVGRHERLLAALLLLLGCALRLLLCGALPVGLNQDEASAGYDAWAILTSGIDRCGDPFPVLLTAWGSGQNALMSYLAMPGIALFGLSEFTLRLPNALSGCVTLWVFWRLARQVRTPRFGLTALLVLTLNPWHIMMSRWALESNLLPCFLLCGVYFTVRSRERPWLLTAASACFGLSLYAYGTAFFFLPLFLVLAVVWLRKALRPLPFCCALALFLLLALPIAGAQLISALGLEELHILGLTLPRLTESRQAATSVFGSAAPLRTLLENAKSFGKLLWTQSDGLIWNSLPILKGGLFYVFGLPCALLGLINSLLHRRERPVEAPLRYALWCSLLCALCISGNINRLNMVWLPLIYFSALGLHTLLAKLGSWAALPLAGVLACCVLFCSAYVRAFGGTGNVNFFPGLGDALRYAEALEGDTVYVTDTVNQPYIFALFYSRTPPDDFVETVEYRNENAAFRQVLRFRGYEFERPEDADVWILWRGREQGAVLAKFGCFSVCIPEVSP